MLWLVCFQGGRMFPNSNQQEETIPVSMPMSGFQSHYAQGGKSFSNTIINSQPLVGVPIMAPPISVLPAPGSVVGTTDIRYALALIFSLSHHITYYSYIICLNVTTFPWLTQTSSFARSSSKPIGAPAQLTIFYAGSVCVYDDISPEKVSFSLIYVSLLLATIVLICLIISFLHHRPRQ